MSSTFSRMSRFAIPAAFFLQLIVPGTADSDPSPRLPVQPAAVDPERPRTRADIALLVFELTNERRLLAGRSILLPELALESVALAHSRDMLESGFFGHESPTEGDFERRLAAGHRTLVGVGGENVWKVEGNLWLSDAELAERIVEDWMQSPGHRANILRENYTHLAVGICERRDELTATQVFAQVRAYFVAAVPATLRIGQPLGLEIRGYGVGASPPVKFDLWSPSRGQTVGGPFASVRAPIHAPPGTYLLRMYFRNENDDGWTIYPAPLITLVG
jgi:uncharacterized protein YkwD